jgi:uncharacterized protein
MENPFKFGTIVEGEYFTDRIVELESIKRVLQSPNHLVLISPRRFGKSSLVKKAVAQVGRPCIALNIQQMTSTADLASGLLKGIFRLHPLEKIRHKMTHFRVVPTVSTNPLTGAIDLSFPLATDENVVLEDVMELLENVGSESKRTIVALDEFQDILELEKGIDKKLRATMQGQKNVNYIFLGSQESMMTEIFERKKSPFYHFGNLMYLKKIHYADFYAYVNERLSPVMGDNASETADEILKFTACHPYYTQQLSSQVWEMAAYDSPRAGIVEAAVNRIITTHDYDYERLWLNFNLTDRRTLQALSTGEKRENLREIPSSTLFSSIQRLVKKGYVIKSDGFELEDPFFRRWIITQLQACPSTGSGTVGGR